MPRAIEIRVDAALQAVVIDTNFPNREVLGATWEPRVFRLGWNSAEEIFLAIQDTAPTAICFVIRLVGPDGDAIAEAANDADPAIISGLEAWAAEDPVPAWSIEVSRQIAADLAPALYRRKVCPPLPDPPHRMSSEVPA